MGPATGEETAKKNENKKTEMARVIRYSDIEKEEISQVVAAKRIAHDSEPQPGT